MEPGDYPLEGNLMYVKVFDQTSIPFEDTRPEIHHHYADVQYWPEGEDLAGITTTSISWREFRMKVLSTACPAASPSISHGMCIAPAWLMKVNPLPTAK